MVKEKSIWVCQNCGYRSSGYLGRCPSCGKWNTIIEEFLEPKKTSSISHTSPSSITSIDIRKEPRVNTGSRELDIVLGGGIVSGSAVLVGGKPGIGKSTLMLQMGRNLAKGGKKILYVSGEESLSQVKLRAERLKVSEELLYIFPETNVKSIIEQLNVFKPDVVVVDSIQSCFHPELSSAPGTVSQVRECAAELITNIKKENIAIFIIGHVTKEGSLAGPMVLEHLVDAVLYFEGEGYLPHRLIRALKNRFGSTNEIGIFEMTSSGLVDVSMPSSFFVSHKRNSPGSIILSAIEGTRSFLVEIQALLGPSYLGFPARKSTGLDPNRVSILIAVLERKAGFNLYNQDVFLNVVGGLKITEPACDLAIALAIASSLKNIFLGEEYVVFGEIGLAGELRPVTFPEKRIKEAEKMGFKNCVLPKGNLSKKEKVSIQLHEFKDIKETIDKLLG
jgi:DNA repair protein RadA/Sms